MAVKSTALKNGEAQQTRYRSPTAIMTPSAAVVVMVRLLRLLAVLLLALSTFGNYVTFAGGWGALGWDWAKLPASIAAINWPMVIAAIVFQGVFAALQWGSKAMRWWLLYGLALLVSAIPSFLTYNAWAGSYFSAQIGAFFAGTIIFLAAIGADALPEWVLVG